MFSLHLLSHASRLVKRLLSPIRRQQQKRPSGDLQAVSKSRWIDAKPTVGLTWGKELLGDNFVAKVASFGAFDADKTILEIGPGYGRLLKACQKRNVPFKSYVAVDISAQNVDHLKSKYETSNIRFVQGDIEQVVLDVACDVVMSSLTLKHIYPTFEKGLSNIVKYVRTGGMFFFDLIEGQMADFEDDSVTYVRWYSKEEVQDILTRIGLEVVAYDYVEHCPGYTRLLVVARKPG